MTPSSSSRFPPYRLLRRLLSRPFAPKAILISSLLLLSGGLNTGLSADDYLHGLIARGSTEIAGFQRHPLDLFRFTTEDSTHQLMEEGVLSWWADPDARVAFWRPVSSMTHWIDHQLWPDSGFMMHLHGLLWGAIAMLGVLAFYRRLIVTPWIMSLAFFLYALDDARGWFVSWVAGRNAVVATALSIWVLVFHHRHRMEGYRAGAWLAPLLLAVSLLAGEGAIAICAYLFAHSFILDTGTLRDRVVRLLPYAMVVLVWRVVYTSLGYGVVGSGLYVDPTGEPLRFLQTWLVRAPVLMYAQMGGSWSDIWTSLFIMPRLAQLILGLAVSLLGVLFYLLWPLVRDDRQVRFGFVGSALCTLPAAAAFPADRLLTWMAIGVSIVLAHFIARYIDNPASIAGTGIRRCLTVGVVLWLVMIKGFLDPLGVPSRARGNVALRDVLDRSEGSIPSDPDIENRVLMLVNPPAVPLAAYIPITRAYRGTPRAITQHWLATGTTPLAITRVDDRTLRVRPDGGYLLNPASTLLRNPRRRFEVGARVALREMTIEVVEVTGDGRPAEILAHFPRSVDDPRLLWRRWDVTRYAPFTPPAVGETTLLPPVDYFKVVFGDLDLPVQAIYEP